MDQVQRGVTRVIHERGAAVEPLLSELVSLALGERISCTYQASETGEVKIDWINVKCGAGVSVSFSLHDIIGIRPLTIALARIRLAQALNVRGQNFASFTEAVAPREDGSFATFLVMTESGNPRGSLSAQWYGEVDRPQHYSRDQKGHPSVVVSAALSLESEERAPLMGKGLLLNTGVNGIIWKLTVVQCNSEWCRVVCMESSMESETMLNSSISLGQLEIPVTDILALRPGSIIEFQAPDNFLATLKVTEREWARGVLAWDGSKATFRVRELSSGNINRPGIDALNVTPRAELPAT